ncbi:MAG TPA: DUF2285 domain-containing protein [Sphingomonas sp.]|nr:DUF2285 domain-containing protein [Sphingomonas sp.]
MRCEAAGRSSSRRFPQIRREVCSFAEDSSLPATEARIFFERSADPFVLPCDAVDGAEGGSDLLETGCFSALLRGADHCEQVLFTDGLRNLRLELRHGTLRAGPVRLCFRLEGPAGIDAPLLALRRLAAFHRLGRMPRLLYPRHPRVERAILTLRAWDASNAGASQREIAMLLFGAACAGREWNAPSDYLHSRIKRMLRAARSLVAGDWRQLLRGRSRMGQTAGTPCLDTPALRG